MFRKFLTVAVLLAAVIAGCTDSKAPQKTAQAGDFKLQDMGGKSVKLSDNRGKVVLLEFWATWCPPCRASVPLLEKLHKTYKDKGLVVLAISVDQGGWDTVQAFVKEYGITYTVLKGDDDVAVNYQVRSIPLTLLVNKDGTVVKRYIGMGFDDELEKEIRSFL